MSAEGALRREPRHSTLPLALTAPLIISFPLSSRADNPLVALGQIRCGWDPSAVVAMLLMDDSHNHYWRTGWNWQGGFTYLPGNGGTLSAVAMMAGGTTTSPPCNFPASWGAVCEGFMQYP